MLGMIGGHRATYLCSVSGCRETFRATVAASRVQRWQGRNNQRGPLGVSPKNGQMAVADDSARARGQDSPRAAGKVVRVISFLARVNSHPELARVGDRPYRLLTDLRFGAAHSVLGI